MEIVPRKPWITQVMTNRIKDGRKVETTNVKEYRRLNN